MNKFIFFLLFLILSFSSCKKDTIETTHIIISSKPNILLVIADDIGVESIPHYNIGSITPQMPVLSSLANEGITFTNVWANPICAPTRATILTGKYGYRTGVLNVSDAGTISSNELTLQSYIDQNTNNAYEHALFGKWHLSNDANGPTNMGIGHFAGLLAGAVSDYNRWKFTENGVSSIYEGYITTKTTDLAINWINEQSSPWFCWVAYTAPHTPFHLPPDSLHHHGTMSTDQAVIDANPQPYFHAMAESVDSELGRLMQSISADELENTIIIFIGDNGTDGQVNQAPYLPTQCKGTLSEGGIRVPLVISGTGVSRFNEIESSLVSSTDLFATIAQIAGATIDQYNDSYSFKNLLSETGNGKRKYNYSEIKGNVPPRSGFTIRNSAYKLIQYDNGNQNLFHLANDPYETTDLILGSLNPEEELVRQELMDQANLIRQ
jgi:arylsulfatase A-like enzyme